MTTIIHLKCKQGAPKRCDAHCYNAIRPRCNCICAGVNHGVGLEIALANNRQWTEADIERMMLRADTDERPKLRTAPTLRDALYFELRLRHQDLAKKPPAPDSSA